MPCYSLASAEHQARKCVGRSALGPVHARMQEELKQAQDTAVSERTHAGDLDGAAAGRAYMRGARWLLRHHALRLNRSGCRRAPFWHRCLTA